MWADAAESNHLFDSASLAPPSPSSHWGILSSIWLASEALSHLRGQNEQNEITPRAIAVVAMLILVDIKVVGIVVFVAVFVVSVVLSGVDIIVRPLLIL